MSLTVELSIEKTTLLFQENPLCRLTATNTGSGALKVAAPGGSPDVPALRVTELKTGIETLQRKPTRPPGTAFQELAPGKKLQYEFRLNSIANLKVPAEYEISVVLPYDMGARQAISPPVRVRLIPVTPRGLALVYGQGGWSAVSFGASVNAASDRPQIVRYEFEVMAEGGVLDARPVVDSQLRANPILSSPPNNHVTSSHWIVWEEGKELAFTHFDAQLGPLSVGRWHPPEPEFAVVPPAATVAAADPSGRPPGAVMLWVGDLDRRLSAFQVVEFSPRGHAQAAGRCEAGESRPTWMMSHITSDGRRLLTFASDTPKGSSLYLRPWPKAGVSGEARLLANWTSHCLSGGAVIVSDDSIYGANLLRSQEREGSKLELVSWKLSPKGEFLAGAHIGIPWDYLDPVQQAMVQVSAEGRPAALLADAERRWRLVDVDGSLKSVPSEVGRTALPLQLAFLNGTEVVLIAGQPGIGFKVMMANGDPLPHLHG